MLSRAYLRTAQPRAMPLLRVTQIRHSSSHRAHKQRDRFSVLANGPVSKHDVLHHIAARQAAVMQSSVHGHGIDMPPLDAAAILFSRDLSSWLNDMSFLSTLLRQISPHSSPSSADNASDPESPEDGLNVLFAAVDSLSPLAPNGTPSSGISILQGNIETLLPGLWGGESCESSILSSPSASRFSPRDTKDVQPSLSMRLNPLLGDFRPVDVTLPVANTVFQNGRPFTMFASRWQHTSSASASASASPLTLTSLSNLNSQRIVPGLDSIQAHADISALLFPVTSPRRILAGLGNIVRQLEIGAEGEAHPASEELEVNIPALIDGRSRHLESSTRTSSSSPVSNATATGPMRVWALVVPPRVASLDFLSSVPISVADSSVEFEHERAEAFARHLSKILADGGHLHRILSGGGGWGAKKGLLSLDPQTTYSTEGSEADLESFMAAFGGEATPGGIVTPGSYIQFLVEPLPRREAIPTSSLHGNGSGGPLLPSLLLGTTQSHDLDIAADPSAIPSIRIADGHFGALSSDGVFVDMTPEAAAAEVHVKSTTHTKIDAPNSYVWQGSSRWL